MTEFYQGQGRGVTFKLESKQSAGGAIVSGGQPAHKPSAALHDKVNKPQGASIKLFLRLHLHDWLSSMQTQRVVAYRALLAPKQRLCSVASGITMVSRLAKYLASYHRVQQQLHNLQRAVCFWCCCRAGSSMCAHMLCWHILLSRHCCCVQVQRQQLTGLLLVSCCCLCRYGDAWAGADESLPNYHLRLLILVKLLYKAAAADAAVTRQL
jgi:hypothetical protein